MQQKDNYPKQPVLPESAQIWDNPNHEYVPAYRRDFRRQKQIVLIDSVAFNASTTTKNSDVIDIRPYSLAHIFIDLAVTANPTDIVISAQFSHNQTNFYKYMGGPWGDLRYEDAAGAKTECLLLYLLSPYMRFNATATGTDGSNIFTLSLYAQLNS